MQGPGFVVTAGDGSYRGDDGGAVRVPVDTLTDIRQTLARIEAALAALPGVMADYRSDQPFDADYEDAVFHPAPEPEPEEDEVAVRLKAALAELNRIEV